MKVYTRVLVTQIMFQLTKTLDLFPLLFGLREEDRMNELLAHLNVGVSLPKKAKNIVSYTCVELEVMVRDYHIYQKQVNCCC